MVVPGVVHSVVLVSHWAVQAALAYGAHARQLVTFHVLSLKRLCHSSCHASNTFPWLSCDVYASSFYAGSWLPVRKEHMAVDDKAEKQWKFKLWESYTRRQEAGLLLEGKLF